MTEVEDDDLDPEVGVDAMAPSEPRLDHERLVSL